MNRWTKPHLGILKRNYPEKGAKYVSKKTGHSASSVTAKAKSLGIKSASIRRWTQFELNYIRKNYPAKSLDSIARSLKRSRQSVEGKARILKIYIPPPKKEWTEKEIELLKKLWADKNCSIDEAARRLNKTRGAVHFRAWSMGLRRPEKWRFWSEEQTRYLRKNYKKKPLSQIAKDLGVTKSSLFHKASRMGFRLKRSPRAWTKTEDDYIRQNYLNMLSREIGEKLDRSADVIMNRAKILGLRKVKKK
jgi:hypothetical protein